MTHFLVGIAAILISLKILAPAIVGRATYKTGNCFVELDRDGGFYKIISSHTYTYVTRAYGSYVRHHKSHPVIVPKMDNIAQVECFEGKYKDRYMRDQLEIELQIAKESSEK